MRRVLLSVAVSLAVCAAPTALSAQTGAGRAGRPARLSPEQSVRQFERAFMEARRQARRGNTTALERILAADFIATSLNGRVVNRAQYIRGSRNPNLRFTSFNVDETNVRVYGASAVVTGRVRITSRTEGGEQTFQFRYTNLYVGGGANWQIAASHLTPVARR